MELNIDPDWIVKMAEKEDCRIVSVGGFLTRQAEMQYIVKLRTTAITESTQLITAYSASEAFQEAKAAEQRLNGSDATVELVSVAVMNPATIDQQILMATLGQAE